MDIAFLLAAMVFWIVTIGLVIGLDRLGQTK